MFKISGTRKTCIIIKALLLTILFASGDVFAWNMNANFESGTTGTLAQGLSGFSYAGRSTTFSSDRSSSGSKSAKMVWAKGDEGFAVDHGEFGFPQALSNGQEIWTRGYFYFASPWSWASSPVVKVLRGAHINNSSGNNVGYLSVFSDSTGNIVLSNEIGDVQTNTGAKFDLDKWQCIEMYVKLSISGPVFRIWKNGTLIYEDTSHATLRSTSDYANLAFIMTNWNGGAPQAQTQYLDEFILTSDRPSQVDSKGNPMIGPLSGGTIPVTLAPPSGLRVTAL